MGYQKLGTFIINLPFVWLYYSLSDFIIKYDLHELLKLKKQKYQWFYHLKTTFVHKSINFLLAICEKHKYI